MMTKKLTPTTLARKLLLGLFGAILVVVVVTHVVMWRGMSRFSVEQTQSELGRDAKMLRDIVQESVQERGEADPKLYARLRLLSNDLALRITLIDGRGEVVFDTARGEGAPQLGSHADRPERLQALARGEGVDERDSETLGKPSLYVAVPLHPGTERQEVLRVSRDLSQLDDSLRRMRDLLYWLASGTLLGALVFSYMMSRLLARPLHAFTRVVREVVRGESQPDELSRTANTAQLMLLADAISTLIHELERVRRRVRRDSVHLVALLDAIDLPVLIANPAGQLMRVNTAAHIQLGLPHTAAHLNEVGFDALRPAIDAAFQAEGPMSTHITLPPDPSSPDTTPIRWFVSVVPMRAYGTDQGVVLVLRQTSEAATSPRRSLPQARAVTKPLPGASNPGERWG
jgi:two-component system, OmpR family, phosphate regulon sensor histidine kinase PhoR